MRRYYRTTVLHSVVTCYSKSVEVSYMARRVLKKNHGVYGLKHLANIPAFFILIFKSKIKSTFASYFGSSS